MRMKIKKRIVKRNLEDRNKLVLILGLLVISFILFGMSFYLSYTSVLQTQTYEVSYEFADKAGIPNLTEDSLNIGKLGPGVALTRNLGMTNEYSFPIIAIISVKGDAKEYLGFENRIILDVNETKKIGFSVAMSDNAEQKVYTGKVTIKIYPYSS